MSKRQSSTGAEQDQRRPKISTVIASLEFLDEEDSRRRDTLAARKAAYDGPKGVRGLRAPIASMLDERSINALARWTYTLSDRDAAEMGRRIRSWQLAG
jgi:hypothetical protein